MRRMMIIHVGKRLVLGLAMSFLFVSGSSAYDKNSSTVLAHFILGGIYERQGSFSEAIEEYKKAAQLDQQNIILHLTLALTHIENKDIPKAIEELHLAIRSDGDAIEPHVVLAQLYLLQDKSDQATAEYEVALQKAVKSDPKNIRIYKKLGLTYMQQKKYKAAEDLYRLILELSPADSEAHFYLGNIYDELKDRPRAIQEFKQCISLKPDYHEALNYLGFVYVEEDRNLDEAGVLIRKALELEPNNAAYIDSLGWFFFKQAKYTDAIRELERASSMIDDPVIFDHLGDAYERLRDFPNAVVNWKKALELDPDQKSVQEKINKISKEIAAQKSAGRIVAE